MNPRSLGHLQHASCSRCLVPAQASLRETRHRSATDIPSTLDGDPTCLINHPSSAWLPPIGRSPAPAETASDAPSRSHRFRATDALVVTRLHQARLLMVRQGMTAEAAGYAVGYESASQFNREFKRLFGLPPVAEVRRMRNNFAVPPAQAASDFVSSH